MRSREACKIGHKEEIEEQLDVGRFLIVLKLRVIKYRCIVSRNYHLVVGRRMGFLCSLLSISNWRGRQATRLLTRGLLIRGTRRKEELIMILGFSDQNASSI